MELTARLDPRFERVIGITKHTLVLAEPWDNPRPPTRVWCLFEGYTTLAKGGRLEVILGDRQRRDLQVRKGANKLANLSLP